MVTKSEMTKVKSVNAPKAISADIAKIDIFRRPEQVRAEWEELSAIAAISPYQSYPFLSAWADTVGREQQLDPFIVVARNDTGRPRALLPLAIDARGPLRIATLLGGRESNFGLALLHPDARFEEKDLRALLLAAARYASDGPDLYYFRNQPRRFDGVENPLAFKDARPSASAAYGTSLPETQEELTARFSKDTRKKLRKKANRLAELGELRYEHCATGERAQEIMRVLIAQKSARFAEMGIDSLFESAGMRDLACRLLAAEGEGQIELHALSAGDRMVATYAGFVRDGRFSAMLNSYDMDETISRSSPGDLLLHALMDDLVARGKTHFDLGAGEARYKNSVCDEIIELCDSLVPVTAKGAIAAPILGLFLHAKRRAKQTPTLARFYSHVRRLLRSIRK